ncbi:MAG: hypothetical protein OEV42_12220 [Deltaproteobacteria bacterium]|nr:hypothetical protein [Deltaproteobacteria bacterium]
MKRSIAEGIFLVFALVLLLPVLSCDWPDDSGERTAAPAFSGSNYQVHKGPHRITASPHF